MNHKDLSEAQTDALSAELRALPVEVPDASVVDDPTPFVFVSVDLLERTLAQLAVLTQSTEELKRWRQWAQFVYLGGGPVTLADDALRHAVCVAGDAYAEQQKTIEARAEAAEAQRDDPNVGYLVTIAELTVRKDYELQRADAAEAALTPLRHELWKAAIERDAAAQETASLKALIEKTLDALYGPLDCTHGNEGDEDICDGCQYQREKRAGLVASELRAALAPASTPEKNEDKTDARE